MALKAGSIIGIIGGGQLGRMMALAAANLGYRIHIFTPEHDAPASQVSAYTTCAEYHDYEALHRFAEQVQAVTFEFENIPHESVKALAEHVPVWPHWNALHISQHRIREKRYIADLGIQVAPFIEVKSEAEGRAQIAQWGSKSILKTAELGYDGKGQYILKDADEFAKIWQAHCQSSIVSWVLEGFVPFVKEVSVVVARSQRGEVRCFEPSENTHEEGMLRHSTAPAHISAALRQGVIDRATKIANALEFVGVMAVEFFITKDDSILVNEMAPRPHNSGHWTMDACITSQFEQHIRAVADLPLGDMAMISSVEMENIIGHEVENIAKWLANPRAKIHLYGKAEARPKRKMGHVNILPSA